MTYPTTALDPDAVSATRMRARLLAGPGAGAFEPMIEAYRRAADGVGAVAADLSWVLHHHDTAHGGRAAGTVRDQLEGLLVDTRADAERLARAVPALQDQAAHHETVRREVAGSDPAAAPPTGAAALLGYVLAAPDGPQRARHALAVYQHNSNHTLTTALPVFGAAVFGGPVSRGPAFGGPQAPRVV